MKFNPDKVSGLTGELFERELFGSVINLDPDNKLVQELRARGDGYLPYEKAIQLVKEHTDLDDATEPERIFARDLHATIAEELCPKDYSHLRFYCARHTSLDVMHGVDAFFEYEDEPGQIYRVTLDSSLRDKDSIKADILIGQIPSKEIDKQGKEYEPKDYAYRVNEIAAQILDLFEERMKEAKRVAA